MVRAHSKYSAFILVLFFLTGCVKTIDLTTGERKVVVECILSEESQQTLLLSLTNGVTGIGPEALDRAVATLIDLTAGSTAGQFVLGEDGVWTLDYAAVPEHRYCLEIDVPGYGTVRAEDTMPSKVDVSFVRIPSPDSDSTYFYHRVHLPANDRWKLPEQDIYLKMAGIFYQAASLPDHSLIEGMVYDVESDTYNCCYTLCTDCPGVVGSNLSGSVYESEIIKGDGYIDKVNPLLDGVSNYIKYLKIDKTKAMGQDYFTIWGAFPTDQPYAYRNSLSVTSLSENYNEYFDNAVHCSQGNPDLVTYLSRESSFSNIEGGAGVFGSKTVGSLPVSSWTVLWEQYEPQTLQSL